MKANNDSNKVLQAHRGGKLEVCGKLPVNTMDDVGIFYTPGVGEVCKIIQDNPEAAFELTIKGNTVLVVSDGSRVLALGNIGPFAAMPVMEGKALALKRFANVNAVPICLANQSVEQTVQTVINIAPGYGLIHLEDFSSPACYAIESQLQAALNVPVFHDDQHGTAIAVLAATINAAKLVKKRLRNLKVVSCGVGAAGLACAKLLIAAGVRNLIGFNFRGAVHKDRTDLTEHEQWLAEHSNPKNFKGTIQEALKGADLVLGLSAPGALKPEWLATMNRDPIVFVLANPVPEILPEEAAPYARVIATGSPKYRNQINNILVFPGFERGLLDCRANQVTEEMKLKAAKALASVIKPSELSESNIIPDLFNPRVVPAIANAVVKVVERKRKFPFSIGKAKLMKVWYQLLKQLPRPKLQNIGLEKGVVIYYVLDETTKQKLEEEKPKLESQLGGPVEIRVAVTKPDSKEVELIS